MNKKKILEKFALIKEAMNILEQELLIRQTVDMIRGKHNEHIKKARQQIHKYNEKLKGL